VRRRRLNWSPRGLGAAKEQIMAIGVVFQGSGVSQDQYQQVFDQVAPDGQLQPGMLYHAAGVGPDGVFVFEVWESQEALQRFFQEQLGQALQQANIDVQPTFIQIIRTMP
jgi:quinol monooxygenase YgiN